MIPILFEAGVSNYASEGVGRLPDGTECTVTWEKNALYEMNLVYPMGGVNAKEIKLYRQIYAQPWFGKSPEIFDVCSIQVDMDGTLTVCAKHEGFRVNARACAPFVASKASSAVAGIRPPVGESMEYTFSWSGTEDPAGDFRMDGCKSVGEVMGGMEGSLLDVYGGTWWREGKTITLMQDPGEDSGVYVVWGKNMTDFSQESDCTGCYTRVLADYVHRETDSETGEETVTHVYGISDSIRPDLPEALQRTLVVDASAEMQEQMGEVQEAQGLENTPTPSQAEMKAWAENYVQEHWTALRYPEISTEVEFVDLASTTEIAGREGLERVTPMDRVVVSHPALEEPVSASVVRTVWDVYNERYEAVTIGTLKKHLDSAISALITKQEGR